MLSDRGVYAHTGQAALSLNATRLQRHFSQRVFPDAIRTAVDEQKILDRIVSDEQVHAPVVVISSPPRQRFACRPRYIRAFATSENVPSPLLW